MFTIRVTFIWPDLVKFIILSLCQFLYIACITYNCYPLCFCWCFLLNHCLVIALLLAISNTLRRYQYGWITGQFQKIWVLPLSFYILSNNKQILVYSAAGTSFCSKKPNFTPLTWIRGCRLCFTNLYPIIFCQSYACLFLPFLFNMRGGMILGGLYTQVYSWYKFIVCITLIHTVK